MFRLKQLFVNETLSLTQKNEGGTVRHSRQVKRQGNCKIYLLNMWTRKVSNVIWFRAHTLYKESAKIKMVTL